jgi:hypothetical protein
MLTHILATCRPEFEAVYCPNWRCPVIYLDRSGADLKANPLHPPKSWFDARSATELQCRYMARAHSWVVAEILLSYHHMTARDITCSHVYTYTGTYLYALTFLNFLFGPSPLRTYLLLLY